MAILEKLQYKVLLCGSTGLTRKQWFKKHGSANFKPLISVKISIIETGLLSIIKCTIKAFLVIILPALLLIAL